MRSPETTAGRFGACPWFSELEEAANRKISFPFCYAAASCLKLADTGKIGAGMSSWVLGELRTGFIHYQKVTEIQE